MEIQIPPFVKNLGHEIIGYILNVDNSIAKSLIDGQGTITNAQKEILQSYIQICRELRFRGIDQNDVDFSLIFGLSGVIVNGKHIFNLWHEQMGGSEPDLDSTDKVVYLITKLAFELYPLFLIKLSQPGLPFNQIYLELSATLYRLPSHSNAIKEILGDSLLSKLFPEKGDSEYEISGDYVATSGRGGSIHLSGLPITIIINAHQLMILRNNLSKDEFAKSVHEVVDILRLVSRGETVQMPIFLGFSNVAVDESKVIETEFGLIKPYHKNLIDLLPQEAKPSTYGDNRVGGFILESTYSYMVEFNKGHKNIVWPKRFEPIRKKLEITQENIGLSFALAIDRDPPIGILANWFLFFDPLGYGMNISWIRHPQFPMPFYSCSNGDHAIIQKWCSILSKANDGKIRIAVRRVLSAISERTDPIDGFVDIIIAMENLFGGPSELSFRISVSIARLLADAEKERFQIQTKVNKLYNDRSKIVHGDKEIDYSEAVQKRNESLKIVLSCLRKLYESRNDLVDDSERSKKLLLE